jgi:predicted RNase H-like nuclease (RuvC/YqgF family)
MLKVGDEIEEHPPQLNEVSNPIVVEVGSMSGTSKTPTLEDLMKKLEKLKAENKRLKTKGKKAKTYSSSSEDGVSLFKEKVSNKGRKERNKHDKPSYNSMSFNYNNMSNSTAYTSVPIRKAPRFDGSNYNQ